MDVSWWLSTCTCGFECLGKSQTMTWHTVWPVWGLIGSFVCCTDKVLLPGGFCLNVGECRELDPLVLCFRCLANVWAWSLCVCACVTSLYGCIKPRKSHITLWRPRATYSPPNPDPYGFSSLLNTYMHVKIDSDKFQGPEIPSITL